MGFIRNKWFVIGIGVLGCIAIAAILYFGFIQSKLNELKAQTDLYEANAQYLPSQGTMIADAQKKVTAAKLEVAQDEAKWDIIQRTKNPVIDMSNIFLAWRQLTNELDFTLGPLLEHQLNNSGVHPMSDISLGGPPNDPNAITSYASYGYIPIQVQAGSGNGPSFGAPAGGPMGGPMGMGGPMAGRGGPPPGFGAPGGMGFGGGGFGGGFGGGGGGAGTIKVTGTFPAILHHVADWNNFQRIALIDGLSLSGNSPNLEGSYNITIYEFPINTNKVGKPVPSQATGGAGMGGPGGAMRPPMAGPPGMPPGGPGAP